MKAVPTCSCALGLRGSRWGSMGPTRLPTPWHSPNGCGAPMGASLSVQIQGCERWDSLTSHGDGAARSDAPTRLGIKGAVVTRCAWGA